MTLQTALSGLLGAQTGLNTVSNDLANASTTAYKSQTALFEDIYPAGASDVSGIGTATEAISSDFTQGDLDATGNPLDAAIQGNGYFVINSNGTQQYTRDGAFQLNSDGQMVTSNGATLMGYSQAANGSLGSTLGPITVNTGAMPANATSTLGLTLNLNSGDAVIPATTAFSPTNAASYDESTSVVTYDSLGNANRVGLYFVQNPAVGTAMPTWSVYAQPETATGAAVGAAPTTPMATLTFTSSGALAPYTPAVAYSAGPPVINAAPAINPPTTLDVNWGNGSAPSAIAFNLTGTTVGAQDFAVAGLTNNGYAPGSYSGTTIAANGQVQSTYSNGQVLSAGTIGIANFINQEGLTPVSGNIFSATQTSGQPVMNAPGSGLAGTLSGGNLEASNASTSSLLVSLIQYQQAYQANTSVIQTEQSDSQRLIQI
jgi:flagellar hook protein FlgE